MNEVNFQTANGVFKKDSRIDELYFTNDGQAFPKKNNALVHQKQLNGKEEDIEVISRSMTALAEASAKALQEEAPKTVDFIVTDEYLLEHLDLVEKGVKAGDTIQVPANE